jgi:ABC-type dipeptide/oligopeptide/nickel transport system ATPase subunit
MSSRSHVLEPAAPTVLSCLALRKTYAMGEVFVRALDGVDFALGRGELVVLLGASGSGAEYPGRARHSILRQRGLWRSSAERSQ